MSSGKTKNQNRRGNTMIKIGENLPEGAVMVMEESTPKKISVSELLGTQKSIIFGVPGAFTPSCSAKHLPGFTSEYKPFTGLGIDMSGCIAVNDIFVMDNWGKISDPENNIRMLADGNADYVTRLGLEWDASEFGLGLRCVRFALILEGSMITNMFVEEVPSHVNLTSASNIIEALS